MSKLPLAASLWCAVAGALVFVAPAMALTPIRDGVPERREFTRSVAQLFAADEFALLDRMADKLWREQARMPEGIWKLRLLHEGLNVSSTQRSATAWPEYFARFERWEKQFPASLTARIAHARGLASYAWAARGGGYANTVSQEGWKLFAERLRQARELLESDPALKASPEFYVAMMTVALGQEWSRAEQDKLFEAAVKLAPDYETFYFSRANALQEKWYGTDPDEWHRFALASAKATEAQLGQTLYTRIVWATLPTGAANLARFRGARIDWPRMRTGFEDLERRHPGSLWNKNAFCFYAWAAGDRATAQRLFRELDGRFALMVWSDPALFQKAQAWAEEK